jgi:branched-chain amino acid aminotransferase
MNQTLVVLDGVHHSPETAKVSVFDRGFLYGDSVFETLRTYDGRPFALDEHLARLERSAARVLIRMPVERAELVREVARALAAVPNQESAVRIMLTRGAGEAMGLDPELAPKPLRVILVTPLPVIPEERYTTGVSAITYRAPRVSDGTEAAGAKVGNYLAAVLAMDAARRAGALEALFVDSSGRVLEGSTSNVFLVSRGVLVTPPEDLGILAGITRAHVLALAAKLGIEAQIRVVAEAELFASDELFICSSIREVFPVVAVDGRTIGDGRPGRVTRELLSAFRRAARAG